MATTVPFTSGESTIQLNRLGEGERAELSGLFIQGLRAHYDAIAQSRNLTNMEAAVLIRDGLPAYVPRPMVYDYIQTPQGCANATRIALRISGYQPADIPAAINGATYDHLTDVAYRVVFGDPKPIAPPAGSGAS